MVALAAVPERQADLVEMTLVYLADYELTLARKGQDFAQRSVWLADDLDAVDTAPALDRFLDCVAPKNQKGQFVRLTDVAVLLQQAVAQLEFLCSAVS
jgi:hypothetical protein